MSSPSINVNKGTDPAIINLVKGQKGKDLAQTVDEKTQIVAQALSLSKESNQTSSTDNSKSWFSWWGKKTDEPIALPVQSNESKAESTKKGLLSRIRDGVVSTLADGYANYAETKVDDKQISKDAKRRIQVAIKSPHAEQFIEFQEFVSDILVKIVKENKEKWIGSDEAVIQVVNKHWEFISRVIRSNVAHAFANLAERIQLEAETNPAYASQSPLTSLISIFCQQLNPVNDKFLLQSQLVLLQDVKNKLNNRQDKQALIETLNSHIFDKAKRDLILKELFDDNIPIETQQLADKLDHPKELLEEELLNNLQQKSTYDSIKNLDIHQLSVKKTRDEALKQIWKKFPNDVPSDIKKILIKLDLLELEKTLHDSQRDLIVNLTSDLRDQADMQPLLRSFSLNMANKVERESLFKSFSHSFTDETKKLLAAFTKNEELYDKMLDQFSMMAADDVITFLLPNRLDSLIVPGLGGVTWIYNIYNQIQRGLADLIFTSYKGVKANPIRDEIWQQDIGARIKKEQGMPLNVEPLTHAPALLLKQLGKSFIRSSPKAGVLVEKGLNWATNQALNQSSEEQKKEEVIGQLSHQRLARWILNSFKEMIYSRDVHLVQSSSFIDTILQSLTLGLLAKSSLFAIPEGKDLPEDQFLSELIKYASEKIKELKKEVKVGSKKEEERLIYQLFNDLLQDLPIPPLLKKFAIFELTSKAEEIQETLNSANAAIQEAQNVHEKAVDDISKYEKEGGKEFLSISEKITDKFISAILEKNVGLIEALGLEETIEDLFKTYLPGVNVDLRLVEWLKKNIGALDTRDNTPESIQIIKQGIQAVILTSIVKTIEVNLQQNQRQFAAVLLHQFHEAFNRAFGQFTTEKKLQFSEALESQKAINDNLEEQERLRIELSDQLQDLKGEHLEVFTDIVYLHNQILKSGNEIRELENKIKQNSLKLQLSVSEILEFQEVLNFHKDRQSLLKELKKTGLSQLDAIRQLHQMLIEDMESPYFDIENIEKYQKHIELSTRLIDLLTKYGSKELELISDTLHAYRVKQDISQEENQLRKQLRQRLAELNSLSDSSLNWEESEKKLRTILKIKESINELINRNLDLKEQLSTKLESFDKLSEELMALIGLGQQDLETLLSQKDSVLSTPFFRETIWPLIQSLKKQKIAALLFEQLSPVLEPDVRKEENIQKIRQKIGKDLIQADLFEKICANVAKDLVGKISLFITSYRSISRDIIEALNQGVIEDNDLRIEQLNQKLVTFMQDPDKRATLNAMSVVEIYESAFGSVPNRELAIEQLRRKKHLLEKLQVVIITPAEIAKNLNDVIPGATDLHKLIEPQLEAVINGKDVTFEKNRELLQKYIEGTLLQRFAKIAEINSEDNESVLAVITAKLQHLESKSFPFSDRLFKELTGKAATRKQSQAFEAKIKQKIEGGKEITHSDLIAILQETLNQRVPSEENEKEWKDKLQLLGSNFQKIQNKLKAYALNEEILKNVAGIHAEKDLDTLPPILRGMAFEKIEEQLKLQLTPVLLPLVERMQSRKELDQKSNSPIFSKLCEAFAKDIVSFIPSLVNSYRPFAQVILKELSKTDPTEEEINELVALIEKRAKPSLDAQTYGKSLSNRDLVEAYASVKKQALSSIEKNKLVEQLRTIKVDQVSIKAKISLVKIQSEEVISQLRKFLPSIENDLELQATLAQELQNFLHLNSQAYQQLIDSPLKSYPSVLQQYIEGVLFKAFIKMTDKNPTQDNKSSLVVITENVIKLAETYYAEIKGKELSHEQIAQGLLDQLMKEILGIQSESDLEGLPPIIQSLAYGLIRKELGGLLVGLQKDIQVNLNSNRQEVKEAKENLQNILRNDAAETLAESLGNIVSDAVPHILSQAGGSKATHAIGEGVRSWLEELKNTNWEVVKVLLDYVQAPELNHLLKEKLGKLANKDLLSSEKKQAAELVKNVILIPLNTLITQLTKAENEDQVEEEKRLLEQNQNLITHILQAAVYYLTGVNAAKGIAKQRGANDFTHLDFVQAIHQRYVDQFKSVAKQINEELGNHLDAAQEQTLTESMARIFKKDKLIAESLNTLIIQEINRIKPLNNDQKEKVKRSNWQDQMQNEVKLDDLHSALPQTRANYGQFASEINKKLNNKLSLNQEQQLTLELEKLAEKDLKNEQPLRNEWIFQTIEKVINSLLGESEKRALEQKDDKGLDLEHRIRQEATAANRQRKEHFYEPISKDLLKAFFPNGRKDLAKILRDQGSNTPDVLINQVWKLLKKQLLPMLIPTLVDTLIDPATIITVIHSSLEKINDNMAGPVILGGIEKADQTHGQLDQASGELIVALVDMLDLPGSIVKKLKERDPHTNQLIWGPTLGSVLRSQFTDQFIPDMLQLVSEKINDPAMKETLKFDTRAEDHPERIADQEKKQAKIKAMENDLPKLTRKMIMNSLSYGIRKKWAEFHHKIEKKLSPRGLKIKKFLDKVFNFIFFKLMGTALNIIFWPIKLAVKEAIFAILKIDKNMRTLIENFTKRRLDEPTEAQHPIHLELLPYLLSEAIKKTFVPNAAA